MKGKSTLEEMKERGYVPISLWIPKKIKKTWKTSQDGKRELSQRKFASCWENISENGRRKRGTYYEKEDNHHS